MWKKEVKGLAEEENIQVEMEQDRKFLEEHQVKRERQQVEEIRRMKLKSRRRARKETPSGRENLRIENKP